jgi:Holliday junction resolvase RusA-like endonuclease
MILTRQLVVKVYGTPAPQGSLRPVGKTKRLLINDNPRTDAWRAMICKAGRAFKLDEPIDGPVIVEVTTTLTRPTTITPAKRPWPSQQSPFHGDVDKLGRVILDGLQDAGVVHNDAQVVQLITTKVYPDTPHADDTLERPGAVIRIYTPTMLEDPP